ncbi:hypothetical protein ASF45_27795 [Pseudorhodoferax sp. Leaf265]|nr:hypothetical protein ASF45_27795 [Pseudorhodoferax sp. Leaf265]
MVARTGLPGFVAAALTIAIVAVQGWCLPEMQRRAEALRQATARMAQPPAHDAEEPAHASLAEQARQSFDALALSSTTAHMDALAKLHETAQALQLRLEVGSYRIERREDEPIVRMEIVVQGRGTYGQLRSFAMRSLQDRALALNAVRWDRSSTAEASVGGEFQFTLFMRSP